MRGVSYIRTATYAQAHLPDPTKIGGKYIDCGFWQISAAQARKLCGGKLPTKAGWYKRIVFDGYVCEVLRTQVGSKSVWAIMTTATPG